MTSQKIFVKDRSTKRTYREILRLQIREALRELKRPSLGLFFSSLAAGLEVSFSVLLMATMLTLINGTFSEPVIRIVVANLYTVGFIFVILGRSELFTEHTTLAVLPVLNGKASIEKLMRLWGIVWAGNITGVVAFSWVLSQLGPALGIIDPEAFVIIARELVDKGPFLMFVSAILAGWLMGLLSWLVAASRDTIGQIVLVWIVTFSIGLTQLHHSIVGSAEVLSAVFVGSDIVFWDYAPFILWSTLGNLVGGSFFVAFMKYRHATAGDDRVIS